MLLSHGLGELADLCDPAFLKGFQPLFRLPVQLVESGGEELIDLTAPKLLRATRSNFRSTVAKLGRLRGDCLDRLARDALLFQEYCSRT